MSRFSELRARLRRVRRRWWLVGAVVVAALLLLSFRPVRPDVGAPVEVKRADLVLTVDVEGELAAVRSTEIGVPPVAEVDFKIAFLAPEGQAVKRGESILRLDTEMVERKLAEKRAEFAEAQKKVEQKEIDLGMKLLELEQQGAQARADLGRAQLTVEVPAEVQQRIELEKALLDKKAKAEGTKNERSLSLDRDVAKEQLDRAETFKLTDEGLYSRHQIIESQLDRDLFAARADVAGRKLDASRKLASAERALGEIDAGKANLKVTIAEKGLRSLSIAAPHDGLLVLQRNWRGEVPFVGDTLWPGQKLAELPDLAQLEARVFVLEADGAGLKTGLGARLAIEGRPGEAHEATVAKVEPLARNRDSQSPVKYFEATLSLARTDPSFMKPGQKVRAVVRLEEAEGVLAIPRGAVFEKDGKRVVYRRERGSFVPVEITVGRQSISRVVLDCGLAAGDVIALRDPTAKRALGPSSPGGAEAGK